MKITTEMIRSGQLHQIGDTIRSVSQAQSTRLFKSENNGVERSAFVLGVISAEIHIALFDLGLPMDTITKDIDPTDVIVEVMMQDGYDFGGENPRVEYHSDMFIA